MPGVIRTSLQSFLLIALGNYYLQSILIFLRWGHPSIYEPPCSTKWLCCLRYCLIICGSHEYTFHPFSFLLFMRHLISLIAGSLLLSDNPVFYRHHLEIFLHIQSLSDSYMAGVGLHQGSALCCLRDQDTYQIFFYMLVIFPLWNVGKSIHIHRHLT